MAEVITRFKLETTQYDSKLRDAAKGLADFTKQASIAGNDFAKFTQKNVEAARSFGNIETSATNAKDKVKELVIAFNTFAKEYNALTKEQQQTDFGKAMAESLNTLKGRISEAKAEMNSTGGIMEQLAQKFTVNIDAIKLFNIGMKAADGALKVAKDAFFSSEANVDEWGRTIKSAQGLYEGFLNAINTGDISGYLTRMDEIVKAAREAYNELDKLGTMKTIQGPQISAQQSENDRMRMMIQTGRYIAPIDGRKATMQNGQLLTPEQIKTLERQLQGGMQKMVGLVSNEVKQSGKAIDAYYNSLAKQNGMTMAEFRKGTSSWTEFSQKMAGYDAYKEWDKNARIEFAKQGGRGNVDFDKSNPYSDFKKWGVFRVDKQGENSLNDLVNLIKQRDQQASQAYSTLSQSYRAINRAEGITVKNIMNGGSGGSGGGKSTIDIAVVGSIDEQTQKVQELQKAWRAAADDDSRQKIKAEIEEQQHILDYMTGKTKVADISSVQGTMPMLGENPFEKYKDAAIELVTPLQALENELKNLQEAQAKAWSPDVFAAYQQKIDDVKEKIGVFKDVKKDADDSAKSFRKAASAVSSVGSAMQSIEDPSAKIMGIIAQAVANIALAFSKADVKDGETGNVWYWIAATAAGVATMVSTIASIKSATSGYAGGGIIKGNSYSGDNIGGLVDGSQFVGLNAGEVVLNASQQQNLASNLQGSGDGKMEIVGVLTGENVVLMADRWGRRTGRGELLFAKNL